MSATSIPTKVTADGANGHRGGGLWSRIEDQFALRQLIEEYLIPVETNTLWYALGGVLVIARSAHHMANRVALPVSP